MTDLSNVGMQGSFWEGSLVFNGISKFHRKII